MLCFHSAQVVLLQGAIVCPGEKLLTFALHGQSNDTVRFQPLEQCVDDAETV